MQSLQELGDRFAQVIPASIASPTTWVDDGEAAFEWVGTNTHAIVSIEPDGTVGYAMRIGDSFEPGQEKARVDAFPSDLLEYLQSPHPSA